MAYQRYVGGSPARFRDTSRQIRLRLFATPTKPSSQYATAIGGTAVWCADNARGWSERAWDGTGSGWSATSPNPPDSATASGTASGVQSLAPTTRGSPATTGRGEGQRALMEHWDGRQWTIVDHPAADIDELSLHAVDGTSSSSLFAVGRYFAADHTERTVIER